MKRQFAIAQFTAAAITVVSLPGPALAQITPATDGTNTLVNPANNTFNITGGTQAGSNLFHSFQQFGLNQGQIATFLSNPSIQNILGRVTGGSPSVINGQIQVTGSNANLFLMNPAGIVFGAGASLNVPASFTATTANAIGFRPGPNGSPSAWFNATGPNSYAALTDAPSSFAFSVAQPGAIVNAGNLAVGPGQNLTLLGGTTVNTGTLKTTGGTVTVAAIPGGKLVRVSQDGSLLSLDLPVAASSGLNPVSVSPLTLPELLTGGEVASATGLTVENGVVKLVSSGKTVLAQPGDVTVAQTIDATGVMGGTVQVLGDRVNLTGATVNASGENGGGQVFIGGDYQGQSTLPTAKRTVVSADSTILANARQRGNGGRVIVWADEATGFAGHIAAKGGAIAGNGGFVEVSGKQLLSFTGTVDVTAAAGTHGQLLLDPNIVLIGADGTDDAQVDDGQILAGDGGASTFRISTTRLVQLLNGGNVAIAANTVIAVEQALNTTANPSPGNLSLTAPTLNLNAPLALKGTLTLTGAVTNTTNRVIDVATTGDLVIQGPVNVSDAVGIPASVKLTSTQGNIFVQTISSGAGGVDINAAGLFQARSGAPRVNVFLRANPTTDPELAAFFQAKGITLAPGQFANVHYQFGNAGESLPVIYSIAAAQSNNTPAGALNAPVTIRYGGATRTLVDNSFPIVATDGTGTVTQGRILIQGGEGAFFLGPTTTGKLVPSLNDAFLTKDLAGNFIPVDPATYNPATTTLYRNQTYTASFPTADFPANISGLAGSIYVGFGSNTTLYGATQNRVFAPVPSSPIQSPLVPPQVTTPVTPTAAVAVPSEGQAVTPSIATTVVQRNFVSQERGNTCAEPGQAIATATPEFRDGTTGPNPCKRVGDDEQILKILGADGDSTQPTGVK